MYLILNLLQSFKYSYQCHIPSSHCLKASNLFTWPYHSVIMNEYEGNRIEFCCSLQHGVSLLTCTSLSEGEAQMVQASRGCCSELLKFFSLSLKSAAIKGSPSCNVIWKATRTVRSWTSTLLEHKIPWRKFKIMSTTSLTSRKQWLNCYLRLPTKKFDRLADVRLALAGIIRSVFHYSVSCCWLYQLASSKCQAFSQLSRNTRKEWTCIWCIRKLCGSALSMTSQLSKCEARQHPYVKITKEVQKMTEFWMGCQATKWHAQQEQLLMTHVYPRGPNHVLELHSYNFPSLPSMFC